MKSSCYYLSDGVVGELRGQSRHENQIRKFRTVNQVERERKSLQLSGELSEINHWT